VGTVLANARTEVIRHISQHNLRSLRDHLATSADPAVQLKRTFRDTLRLFFQTDKFGQLKEQIDGRLPSVFIACMFCIFFAICLMLGGLVSAWMFARHDIDVEKQARGENPYNGNVYQAAGCTWCWAFFYASFVLFVGGMVLAVTIPLSGVCLILEHLDSNLVTQVAPSIGLNATGDSGEIIMNATDQCFQSSIMTNKSLLDVIFARENMSK